MKRTTLAGIVLTAMALPAIATPDRACRGTETDLRTLFDGRSVSCVVTGARDRGGYSLLLIADFTASANDRSWRAFKLFACTAAGRQMRMSSGTKFKEVWMTDTALARAGEAEAVAASLCSSWQADVHAGRRTMQEIANEVENRSRRIKVNLK